MRAGHRGFKAILRDDPAAGRARHHGWRPAERHAVQEQFAARRTLRRELDPIEGVVHRGVRHVAADRLGRTAVGRDLGRVDFTLKIDQQRDAVPAARRHRRGGSGELARLAEIDRTGLAVGHVQAHIGPVGRIEVVLQVGHEGRSGVGAVHPEIKPARPAADRRIAGERIRAAIVAAVVAHAEVRPALGLARQLHRPARCTVAHAALRVRPGVAAVAQRFPVAGTTPQVGPMAEVAEAAAVPIAVFGKLVKRLLDEPDVPELRHVAFQRLTIRSMACGESMPASVPGPHTITASSQPTISRWAGAVRASPASPRAPADGPIARKVRRAASHRMLRVIVFSPRKRSASSTRLRRDSGRDR